jgi:hypothetical protein
MNYDKAAQTVSENLAVIGQYGKLGRFPYLIKYLLIVPSTADFALRMEILQEWLSNDFDNSEALFNLDLQNEQDFTVIMIGEYEGIFTDFNFMNYLKENS